MINLGVLRRMGERYGLIIEPNRLYCNEFRGATISNLEYHKAFACIDKRSPKYGKFLITCNYKSLSEPEEVMDCCREAIVLANFIREYNQSNFYKELA